MIKTIELIRFRYNIRIIIRLGSENNRANNNDDCYMRELVLRYTGFVNFKTP